MNDITEIIKLIYLSKLQYENIQNNQLGKDNSKLYPNKLISI